MNSSILTQPNAHSIARLLDYVFGLVHLRDNENPSPNIHETLDVWDRNRLPRYPGGRGPRIPIIATGLLERVVSACDAILLVR